jgi:hypothetical protein
MFKTRNVWLPLSLIGVIVCSVCSLANSQRQVQMALKFYW